MSVALRGNIQDFGIAEVFQLVGQQRKTGILEFAGKGRKVQLVFDRGNVVSATPKASRPHDAYGQMLVRCGLVTREKLEDLHRECAASAQTLPRLVVSRGLVPESEVQSIEDLLTRETIFDLLRWESGSFDFQTCEVDHDRSVQTLLGAEQILMDGLRMVDEWQSFAEQVPAEDLVFQRTGRFEDYRAQGGSRVEDAQLVFQLIDGRLAVRRIIDLSRLGTFDATRILADLRRAGVIEPLDPGALRRLRRPRRLLRPRVHARAGLAALLPLVLLLVVAGLAQRPRTAPAPLPGTPIERPALQALRAAHRARAVRHAIEAHRFRTGDWPATLAELETGSVFGPLPLASPEAPAYNSERAESPYYFAVREEGALFLSER